jgi:hypothetical protein
MKYLIPVLAAVVCAVLVVPAFAQTPQSEAEFQRFLAKHPEVQNNPSLLSNQQYLAHHPNIAKFLTGHPRVHGQALTMGAYNEGHVWPNANHGSFFQPHHTAYFRQCYTQPDALPPGLQKQVESSGHLPPGLEMQLHRNGHLPPGLEKKMVPVTECVDNRIGPLPPDTRLYLMGRNAYLINEHTHAIVDILHGVY